MWIRMRLDIGWRDLLSAACYCLIPGNRQKAINEAQLVWGNGSQSLITLSVRSSFDLLLTSLNLPKGSEVMMSALTVPDMLQIVKAHGLIPVAVDTDEFGHVTPDEIRKALTKKSRILVLAQLFGSAQSIRKLKKAIQEHSVYIVEDCAQNFFELDDTTEMDSDFKMFSFGPIKTATALGGSVIQIASPNIKNDMEQRLQTHKVQSNTEMLKRTIRFSLLKLATNRVISKGMYAIISASGRDFDQIMNRLGRGFKSENLLNEIRQQPATAQIKLLSRRWQNYDYSRIEKRVAMGEFLDHRIQKRSPDSHTYWIYPVFVAHPANARTKLMASGFDATTKSRMCLVPPTLDGRHAPTTSKLWQHILFLPWYPELSPSALERLADTLAEIEQLPHHYAGGRE